VEILKVSGSSVPRSVAGAIASVLRREEAVAVQAVGAMAVNQAVKSMAIAREYLVGDAWDISITPSFEHIIIDGSERTAIKFTCARVPRIGVPVVGAPLSESAELVAA
jgi:stage V sporulation protein S